MPSISRRVYPILALCCACGGRTIAAAGDGPDAGSADAARPPDGASPDSLESRPDTGADGATGAAGAGGDGMVNDNGGITEDDAGCAVFGPTTQRASCPATMPSYGETCLGLSQLICAYDDGQARYVFRCVLVLDRGERWNSTIYAHPEACGDVLAVDAGLDAGAETEDARGPSPDATSDAGADVGHGPVHRLDAASCPTRAFTSCDCSGKTEQDKVNDFVYTASFDCGLRGATVTVWFADQCATAFAVDGEGDTASFEDCFATKVSAQRLGCTFAAACGRATPE